MRNKKRSGIVFYKGSLIAVIVLFTVPGIIIGLMLTGPFRTRETQENSRSNYNSLQDSDALQSGNTNESLKLPIAAPSEENPDEMSTPSATPEDAGSIEGARMAAERAAAYVASMSLHEKICQMLIVAPDSITGISGITTAGPTTKAALEQYPMGGLILFSENIISGEQVALFNSTAQTYSKIPMLITIDEEGGSVGRLKMTLGAHSVGAMLAYESGGEQVAFDNAKILSHTLKKYGFNVDFAPVADVWSNPENSVIGDRAYSSDFNSAAKLVAAAVRGFKDSNMVCSLKHFPGHGDTYEDSHNGTAYVKKTLNELRENEFKPFKAGIEAGADMVMAGHLVASQVDELPATLSKTMLTDVLRGELDFNGVIITDSLAMGAISYKYSTEYVAVMAVKAGVDILLMPNNVEGTVAALTSAVKSGEISESRIDGSVVRIIELKAAHGIIDL